MTAGRPDLKAAGVFFCKNTCLANPFLDGNAEKCEENKLLRNNLKPELMSNRN